MTSQQSSRAHPAGPADGGRGAPSTVRVSNAVFQQVYDSPASLPGKYRWLTTDADVRNIERLLGMPQGTIGAPLWVSGDRKTCEKCGRQVNWLDIVSSALARVHGGEMIAAVILGEHKFVNTEAPRAIADLACHACKAPIRTLRSFKCHNWAYARPAFVRVLQEMERSVRRGEPGRKRARREINRTN